MLIAPKAKAEPISQPVSPEPPSERKKGWSEAPISRIRSYYENPLQLRGQNPMVFIKNCKESQKKPYFGVYSDNPCEPPKTAEPQKRKRRRPERARADAPPNALEETQDFGVEPTMETAPLVSANQLRSEISSLKKSIH